MPGMGVLPADVSKRASAGPKQDGGDASSELTQQQAHGEDRTVFDYQDGPENGSWAGALPLKQGLYDPELEKDSCGVGFAA